LVEVWLYIAENDARAADRMLADIDDKCRLLALQPELGPARDDIAPGLRFLSGPAVLDPLSGAGRWN
jgi:toxin ParE1/3/4